MTRRGQGIGGVAIAKQPVAMTNSSVAIQQPVWGLAIRHANCKFAHVMKLA